MDVGQWHALAFQDGSTLPDPWPDLSSRDDSVRQAAIDELESALMGAVLPFPPAIAVGVELTRLIQANETRPAGSKTIAGVSAPFSAGKSTAVTDWAFERYRGWVGQSVSQPPIWQPEPGIKARLVPVIYLSLLSSAGVKELNAQILSFLGYPGEGIARVTSARVNTAMRRHGVRLLIVDDVHMLRLGNRTSRLVLDYLKTLNSELGFLHGTMVFVGPNLEAAEIFEDPQIRGRLRILSLEPAEIESENGRRDWQRFLHTCESILLPYLSKSEPGTFSSKHAGFIWHRTQGFVGDTGALLCGAVVSCLRRGGRTIVRDDLVGVQLSARAIDAQFELERLGRGRRI